MDTNLFIIGVAVFFMLGAIFIYLKFFRDELSDIDKEIKDLISYLENLKQNANSENMYQLYIENFEDIKKEFEKYDAVKPIWQDFEKSLTRYKDDKTEQIYSVADVSEYFSFHNFTQGMNISFWQSYGGTFTGLGILGTFFGLTFGLSKMDMTSSDIEVLKSGIAELLSGVQLAFITSLVGIGFALFYGFWHNDAISKFKERVQKLSALIEEMFPRRTSEYWLHGNYTQSTEQTKLLQNIGTDVAQAVFEKFDQRFDDSISKLCDQIEEKITPMFEKVCNAVDKLGDGGTNALNETMTKFAGSQMQSFADSLNNFTNNVQKTLNDSQKTGETMNQIIMATLEEMRNAIKSGAEDAANYQRESVKENSETISRLIENMRNFTEQQKQMLEQFANNNTSQIKLATETFQNSVSSHLQQTLSASKQATEEVSTKFSATLDEMFQIIKVGTEDISKSQRESLKESIDAIGALTEKMKSYSERQEQMLNKSVAENARKIESANNLFQSTLSKHNTTMEKSYTQMEKLLQATENLLQNIKTATASLGQAAAPLQQGVLQLRESLKENEIATRKFHDEISIQINKLVTANQKSEDSIEELVLGLEEYEKNIERAWVNYENNFNRVGGELEKATNIITQRLQDYNNMMNNGMKQTLEKFDRSVTDAVGLLNSAVEDLQDSVDSIRRKV